MANWAGESQPLEQMLHTFEGAQGCVCQQARLKDKGALSRMLAGCLPAIELVVYFYRRYLATNSGC